MPFAPLYFFIDDKIMFSPEKKFSWPYMRKQGKAEIAFL
jgi:hypothetical protein